MSLSARWSAALAGLAACALAQAQGPAIPPAADPGAAQQRSIEMQRRQSEEERVRPDDRPPVERPPLPATPPAPDTVRFFLREVEFTSSEILSREALEAIAAQYRGRTVSLADVQEIAARVNRLYRDKGVVTAQAVVPPQDVTDGIVRIRLVEGRVGKVSVQGNASTSESYVIRRVTLAPGELVDLARLERDLVFFNRTNDAQTRAELRPGERFGTTDVLVSLAEPPRHLARFFVDNAGAEATGEWRRGASYLNRSLFGRRDDLSLNAARADGHEGYWASYGAPINRVGGRLTLAAFSDRTQIRHGPLATLNITGKSRAATLLLRQPAYVGARHQVDALIGGSSRDSETHIDGVLLQTADTRDFSLGGEVQASDASGHSVASLTRVWADTEAGFGRRNVRLWRAGAGRTQKLSDSVSLRGQFSMQNSRDDLLPSTHQFFVGGEGNARGYPTGLYSGDDGYLVNLELHHALPLPLRGTGFAFYDRGVAKPLKPAGATQERDRVESIGWGLNFSATEHVAGRAVFGYALDPIPGERRRYRIHVQLVASLF